MLNIYSGEYAGLKCEWMVNPYTRLAVVAERGLRAIFFSLPGRENIFAELGDMAIHTELGDYYLLGGHRLWHSPEWAPRTYYPENQEITITRKESQVTTTTAADGSGIKKKITFQMAENKPQVFVRHQLINEGLWGVELAPWAITQCQLGGVVLCPQNTDPENGNIGTPNRSWVFWQFSDINDKRFLFDNRITRIKAESGLPTKLGYRNTHGWIGYLYQGILFTKHFKPQIDRSHTDLGCNTEVYSCEKFVELETLAPLTILDPGKSVSHDEIWTLWSKDELKGTEDDFNSLLNQVPTFDQLTGNEEFR